MSRESDITQAARWHYGEIKDIDIRIYDDNDEPLNITNDALVWTVARERNSTRPYLTLRTGAGITAVAHEDDSGGVLTIARCHVEETDYEGFPGPGMWRHEMRDESNGLVLAAGKAALLPAMYPREETS